MNQTKAIMKEEMDQYFDQVVKVFKNHRGSANAVSAKEVAEQFGIHQRTVRSIAKSAMYHGVAPIISFNGTQEHNGIFGFFVAETQEEYDLYVESIDRKIDNLKEKKEKFIKCFTRQYDLLLEKSK